MIESFWNIPEETIATPHSIIKSQAQLLTDATKGVLIGEVDTLSVNDSMNIYLTIRVPNLNNYKVQILRYNQPLSLYPGQLMADVVDIKYLIDKEENFYIGLKNILSSQKTKHILASLLSQARSDGESDSVVSNRNNMREDDNAGD